MRSRARHRKKVLGKQWSVGWSVAAAFHTGRAGDMSCEWTECEPSSHSSGNIILSLASFCLFCVGLALPCYWNASSVCLGQRTNRRLSQVWGPDQETPSEDKDSACISCKWENDLVTHVSVSLAWTVIICQQLKALPNSFGCCNLFYRQGLTSWPESGNVCQLTSNWESGRVAEPANIRGSLKCFVKFVWHTLL